MNRQFRKVVQAGALVWMLALGQSVLADGADAALTLQQQWEKARYQMEGDAQLQAYEQLMAQAEKDKAAYPDSADVFAWSGIIKATYAGAKGGLGALKYAKSSKSDLETALGLNEAVMDGGAHNTLGTLYYKVPGWPVGFGDSDKAKEQLQRSLALNPKGIDSNYFYGEFLRDQGDYQGAWQYYEKALAAPPRPARPLADSGRRGEVEDAMEAIRTELD
ncbi:hypothetical protein [Pseudomaricurvus sp. HS19]|uniref:hypothetical protein n=1 Tax=Pseudomaricurvus sp. HS19 TaxID=2692626 RepID=UPI00137073AE|nr:hypothetical protein [Pseudomaricurvus sp. HS19]MYM64918.1 hypothetical protein [Pseudomaricurvus sp. HS19]